MIRRQLMAAALLATALGASAPALAFMSVNLINATDSWVTFAILPGSGRLGPTGKYEGMSYTPTEAQFGFTSGGSFICKATAAWTTSSAGSVCTMRWDLFSPRCADKIEHNGSTVCYVTITLTP